MNQIIPALIPRNLNIVWEQFAKVRGLVRKVQIDIVDGQYAPEKTWPFNDRQSEELLSIVREEEKFPYIEDFDLEVDMLVYHPVEYISDLLSLGAKSFVIHLDSTDHLKECLETVRNASCESGIGIKPSGDFDSLESYLDLADFVQFMGNDRVGYNGVSLDEKVLDKIKNFHKRHPSIPIQIDIGVNLETLPKLKAAGCSRFISNSSIFNTLDTPEALRKLQKV